jgi:hypothetical protein
MTSEIDSYLMLMRRADFDMQNLRLRGTDSDPGSLLFPLFPRFDVSGEYCMTQLSVKGDLVPALTVSLINRITS